MDLATMGSLVGTLGFPIAITLIVSYILYKVFRWLCDKFIQPMLDRVFKSLDEITESNKILVETNASFVGNINNKIEDIETKVDKIVDKLG